jgi:archaellum component FlaC
MSKEINGFAETMNDLIKTFNELSLESNDIITSLESLKNETGTVKTNYAVILTMTDKLRDSIHELKVLSKGS